MAALAQVVDRPGRRTGCSRVSGRHHLGVAESVDSATFDQRPREGDQRHPHRARRCCRCLESWHTRPGRIGSAERATSPILIRKLSSSSATRKARSPTWHLRTRTPHGGQRPGPAHDSGRPICLSATSDSIGGTGSGARGTSLRGSGRQACVHSGSASPVASTRESGCDSSLNGGPRWSWSGAGEAADGENGAAWLSCKAAFRSGNAAVQVLRS